MKKMSHEHLSETVGWRQRRSRFVQFPNGSTQKSQGGKSQTKLGQMRKFCHCLQRRGASWVFARRWYTSLLVCNFLVKQDRIQEWATIFTWLACLHLFPIPKTENIHEITAVCHNWGDNGLIVRRVLDHMNKRISEAFRALEKELAGMYYTAEGD